MKKSDEEKYEKKIKGLEERIGKLEREGEKKKEEPRKELEETNAAEILRGVGRMFGLSGVIKSAEKLPEFQERLKKVDEELKRKLRTTPLRRAGEKTPYQASGFRAKSSAGRKPRAQRGIPSPQEREVDIFDEDEYILAIIEIHGADEKSINVNLEKDRLNIFADKAGKKYHKEIILPCVPVGEIARSYKNGILEVKINKKKKPKRKGNK